jgi:hypothetical protein
MITPAAFEQIWQHAQKRDVVLTPPAAADARCVYAKKYTDWAEQAYRALPDPPTIAAVHQVILLNTLKYFEFRSVVPKTHRDLISDRGHTCIFHVFEETFQLLKFTILSLPEHTTLLLPRPAPPPPPAPRYEIAGVPIGLRGPEDEA